MTGAKQRRLSFILGEILSKGWVRRSCIINNFLVSTATAAIDLRDFQEHYPGAAIYSIREKRYIAGPALSMHAAQYEALAYAPPSALAADMVWVPIALKPSHACVAILFLGNAAPPTYDFPDYRFEMGFWAGDAWHEVVQGLRFLARAPVFQPTDYAMLTWPDREIERQAKALIEKR